MSHPMQGPPDRTFWLDKLIVLGYPEVVRLRDDFAAVEPALRQEFRGPKTKAVLEETLNRFGRTPSVAKNLLLVSQFLTGMRSDPVGEVARRYLPRELVEDHRYATGDYQRHALATLLYGEDPDHLVEIQQWNRAENFRRAVFLQRPPHRKLAQRSWGGIDWGALVATAQPTAAVGWSDPSPAPALKRAVHSADGTRVLLAFVRPEGRRSVRAESGEVVPGSRDAWTYLLLQDQGRRIDVGGDDDRYGGHLVTPLGRELYADEELRYVIAHQMVTETDLQRMLRRMLDPGDDDVRLLQITAEFPEDWHRSIFTVGNTGQVRVEGAVRWLHRAGSNYAMNWKEVKSTQVSLGTRHRIQIHFPRPGGERIVTFSQVGRRSGSNEEFRAAWHQQFQWDIYPKSNLDGLHGTKPESEEAPHRDPTERDWTRLLQTVVVPNEQWEERELKRLNDAGVLRYERKAWFLCGSPGLPRRRGTEDTLDCDGEVEFDWRDVDPEDLSRLEDDHEVFCNAPTAHRWRPFRDRIPLQRRLRVTLDRDGSWQWVLAHFADHGIRELKPGVGGGSGSAPDALLILACTGTPANFLLPSTKEHFTPCWVLLPGDTAPPGCEDRVVPFTRFLVEGASAVLKVWRKHGKAPTVPRRRPTTPAAAPASEPPPAPAGGPPTLVPVSGTTTDGGSPRTLTYEKRRILLNGGALFDKPAPGVALGVALLLKGAEEDRKWFAQKFPGVKPVLRSRDRKALVRLAAGAGVRGARVKPPDVSTWISRLVKEIDDRSADVGCRAADVVVQDADGHRLADGVSCHGFDLVKLLQARGGNEKE